MKYEVTCHDAPQLHPVLAPLLTVLAPRVTILQYNSNSRPFLSHPGILIQLMLFSQRSNSNSNVLPCFVQSHCSFSFLCFLIENQIGLAFFFSHLPWLLRFPLVYCLKHNIRSIPLRHSIPLHHLLLKIKFQFNFSSRIASKDRSGQHAHQHARFRSKARGVTTEQRRDRVDSRTRPRCSDAR